MPNSTDTLGLPVDVRRLPWIRRLAADYTFNFTALAPFFAGDPSDPAAWAGAVSRTQGHGRDRSAIASIIAAQQARRGAPPRAVEAGRLLADPRTVAVVTGQQAGLFGGPLFTLLKAWTAIMLAERLTREQQVPAVAVFWIDAEDHDWDEVRSCTVFDAELAPRTVSLAEQPADAQPVAARQLDQSVSAIIDTLESALPATEFRPALMADLRAAYAPGVGMADAFGRWMERVLGGRGLVVYDASDRAAKPLAARVFERELATAATASLASAQGAELVARGYHAQVEMAEGQLALFGLNGGRRPLRSGEAAPDPSVLSPNVLLRPIVQDTLFPTVCYVAGPNELAYLAQLGPVYKHFGVPMPLMYPRASASLVDSAALRFLTKYDVSIPALQPQDESALNDLLKAQIPPAVEAAFNAAGTAVDQQMQQLAAAIGAIDPTLEGAARNTLGRMQHDLQTLHGKMLQAAKRRDETLRRQFTRTRSMLFPNGHSQEREIGFVSFLNQYGPALVERLDDALPLEPGRHWVIAI